MNYDKVARDRVLRAVYEHFLESGEPLSLQDVAVMLGWETNPGTLTTVGKCLVYWIERRKIDGRVLPQSELPYEIVHLVKMTASGIDYLESDSRLKASGDTTYTFHNSTIGVAGPVSGGSVTQTFSNNAADFARALHALAAELGESTEDSAPVAEALAEKAASAVTEEHPEPLRLSRVMVALSQTIQTMGAVPAAYALVCSEAAKHGFSLPQPLV